jgi:hypothetical protein
MIFNISSHAYDYLLTSRKPVRCTDKLLKMKHKKPKKKKEMVVIFPTKLLIF